MKDYQKPELEFISFVPAEAITNELDDVNGLPSLGSNPFED